MENKPKFTPNPKLKLMDQVREVLRYHHYAYRTEQTYAQWILRFIHFFGGKTHPRDLSAKDIERFLSDLDCMKLIVCEFSRATLDKIKCNRINSPRSRATSAFRRSS
ncbi:MAG: phage integrase N-terminal SAM-like domain-containing protein [Desulfobulbaceae bacterium]|nr:phage integrase N-terminal SAM-like domain-containing protein [Desulfobulbaceae bacterium]